MDDLDHSVLIAEQDWDNFYAESEECSIQLAGLASLDDSLSDSDENNTSSYFSTQPAQITANVEEQKPVAVDCEPEHTFETFELPENSIVQNESAGQTNLNLQEATSEYLGLDHNKSSKERSHIEPSNLKGKRKSQNQESGQANIKSVSEIDSLCIQDVKHENRTESTRMEGTDSSPMPRKEKERWFVTMDYSPVRLRQKVVVSGPKKRRKKKLSRNGGKHSGAEHEKGTTVKNTEAENCLFEMPEKFRSLEEGCTDLQPTTNLNNTVDNNVSETGNIQELLSSSSIEPTADNFTPLFNHTEEKSPRFILGTSTTLAPSDGERKSEQKETSPQETTESSSNSAKIPDATSGPTRPIFALSSFWDEMEKLTINDILELRIANNNPPVKESLIAEEDETLDTTDAHSKDDQTGDSGLIDEAADSDYFTHTDDCKPDRSSCEFSTFSDYDEEYVQVCGSKNPSPEPSESIEQSFLEHSCAKNLFQEASWQSPSESNKIGRLYPESDLPLFLYSEVETQTQDLYHKTTQDNMSSLMLNHCDMRRSTPSPVLTMSDVLDGPCLKSLFEILKDDKDSRASISVLFPLLQCLSVAEMYDHFFSDFEVANFLFPSVKRPAQCEKSLVPIYSSSRSVVKDLNFPEVKEIMPSGEIMPITHFSSHHICADPSGTPNLCLNGNHRDTWRNLSLRQIKFSFMGRTWCRMATSSRKNSTDYTSHQENWDIALHPNLSKSHPNVPVLLQKDQALGLGEKEIYVGQDVPGPGRQRFCYSLNQADLCLVCIAFASWVLKSSNPQSTDMWKAALLANVSAISAIQYLRRYIKEEDEP